MITYAKNILLVLGNSKREIPKIGVLFVIISLFDLFGLAMIGPYLSFMMDGNADSPPIFNSVLPSELAELGRERFITWFSILLVSLYIVKNIVLTLMTRHIMTFAQSQQVSLRSRLISGFQALPFETFSARNSSDYLNIAQTMVGLFVTFVMNALQGIGDIIVAIVVVSVLAYTDLLAFCLLAVLMAITFVGYDRFTKARLTKFGLQSNQYSEALIQRTNEALRGFKDIRMLGAEPFFANRIVRRAQNFADVQVGINFYSALPKYLIEMIVIIFIVAFAVSFSVKGQSAANALPALGVFGVAAIRLLPIVRSLMFLATRARVLRPTVFALAKDLSQLDPSVSPASPSSAGEAALGMFTDISLEGIKFAYNGTSNQILNNVTFTMKAGEKIGLVGASGAGKSTLVSVLLGLLQPQEGSFKVNGREIKEVLPEWRQQIAYLPQDIFVIDASIASNIALGEAQYDKQQVLRALQRANLDEMVKQLPQGLDTFVGEHGFRLSGGQRQRLALARAFYFGRALLILDESTSALDAETEELVLSEIESLAKDLTIITISHRPQTIARCEKVFSLIDGQLTEMKKGN